MTTWEQATALAAHRVMVRLTHCSGLPGERLLWMRDQFYAVAEKRPYTYGLEAEHSHEKVSEAEFARIFAKDTLQQISECKNLFRAADTSASGFIDIRELLTLICVVQTDAAPEMKLRVAFMLHDTDNDGFLGIGDLRRLLGNLLTMEDAAGKQAHIDEIVRTLGKL